jgi:hypothetical protein
MLWVSYGLQWSRPFRFDSAAAARSEVRLRVYYEYIPLGVVPWDEFDKVSPSKAESDPRAQLLGAGRLDVERWATHSRRLRVSAPSPVKLQLRTFAYPGWEVRIDGDPVPVHAADPLHVIEVEVPAGTHRVDVEFERTPDRVVGALLSAIGIIGLAAGSVFWHLRRRREGS